MQTPSATSTAGIIATGQGRVVAGIREAATATGVPFDYLLAQATRESGLDPEADNRRSTASGLFQFTSQTWLDMVRRHGAEHGLADAAAAIVQGRDGRLDIADKSLKKTVLDLRKDPAISAMMAAEYARDNAEVLQARLGREVTASDLHLAHFLGAGGALRVIKGMAEDPRHSARSLLPEAARANPELFHDSETSAARSVASLYRTVQARYERALNGRSDLAELKPAPRPDEIELAAAAVAPDLSVPESGPDLAFPDLALDEPAVPPSTVVAAYTPEGPALRAAIPAAADRRPDPVRMADIVAAIRSGEGV